MTDLSNENISDLMDNEWHESTDGGVDELVQAISDSHEIGQKWARYHLMRDVMQNEYTTVLDADFAAKVSSAIDAEPAIIALPASTRDVPGSEQAAASPPVSLDHARQQESGVQKTGWKRMASGAAIAASVAVVSIVGLNFWRGDQSHDAPIVAEAPITPGISAGAEQLELVANRGTYWVDKSQNGLSQKNQEKLNMFLSQHIENAPTAHSGMFPYSRLVGFDRVRVESTTGQ